MSCMVLDRESYERCADEVFFLTDNVELANDVCKLYELNQKAYNVRYRERNKIDRIKFTKECNGNEILTTERIHYIESRQAKYTRIVQFFACVYYQNSESQKLEKQTQEIIGLVLFNLSKKIFDNDELKYGVY